MKNRLERRYGHHHLHFITCSCCRRLPFLRTARDLKQVLLLRWGGEPHPVRPSGLNRNHALDPMKAQGEGREADRRPKAPHPLFAAADEESMPPNYPELFNSRAKSFARMLIVPPGGISSISKWRYPSKLSCGFRSDNFLMQSDDARHCASAMSSAQTRLPSKSTLTSTYVLFLNTTSAGSRACPSRRNSKEILTCSSDPALRNESPINFESCHRIALNRSIVEVIIWTLINRPAPATRRVDHPLESVFPTSQGSRAGMIPPRLAKPPLLSTAA